MTTFDDREKSFEKKFAMDQDLKFKAESRRNKMLAEWAAAKLGMSGAAVEDYVKAVRKADLAEKGDDDVFRKVAKDMADKGVSSPTPRSGRKWALSWPRPWPTSRRAGRSRFSTEALQETAEGQRPFRPRAVARSDVEMAGACDDRRVGAPGLADLLVALDRAIGVG